MKYLSWILIFSLVYGANLNFSDLELKFNSKVNNYYAGPNKVASLVALLQRSPYMLGALGEGSAARYDKHPLYRIDKFDCQTYITTLIAILAAENLVEAKQNILKIRYSGQKISYFNRNHFPTIDFLPNLRQLDFSYDIAKLRLRGLKFYRVQQIVNKGNWLQHAQLDRLYLPTASKSIKQARLAELIAHSMKYQAQVSDVSYIKPRNLLDASGNLNYGLLVNMPRIILVMQVMQAWEPIGLGTVLPVSHMGLVYYEQGKWYYTDASLKAGYVRLMPLRNYLHWLVRNQNILGLHLEGIHLN